MLLDHPREATGTDSRITVQHLSDLPLERIKYDFTVTRAAPVLMLAGDVGRFCDYDQYRDFLAKR